jgi:MFS family permease
VSVLAEVARTGRNRLPALIPDLLRERTFRNYWSAHTVSLLGDQISSIALPLTAVLALHARAAEMGYLTAAIWLPSLLFATHAGALADRVGRRRIMMITADLGRAALLTSVPVCYALHVLTLAQLYGVAFAAGTLSTLFNVCDGSLSVAIMPEDKYVEGNSLLNGSRAFSYVGGPSLGGLLVQVFSAPFAVVADVLSFLGSAFLLHRIKPAEPPADPGGKGALTVGATFIARNPIMRASLAAMSVVNFFNFVFAALILLYASRTLHVPPGELGLVFGAGAVGTVTGSLTTGRVAARTGIGEAYVIGALLFTAPLALMPLAGGPTPLVLGMLFLGEFLSGYGVMLLDISIGAIYAVIIPAQLRSRVSGAFSAVNYGTRPIGALVGGTLGTVIGLRAALWVGVIGGVAGALILLPTSIPRFKMPALPPAGRPLAEPAPGEPEPAGPGPAEHAPIEPAPVEPEPAGPPLDDVAPGEAVRAEADGHSPQPGSSRRP